MSVIDVYKQSIYEEVLSDTKLDQLSKNNHDFLMEKANIYSRFDITDPWHNFNFVNALQGPVEPLLGLREIAG